MKPSATALIAFDGVLGASIGPGNLWLMLQLARTERSRDWLASATPWAGHLYEGMFWYLFAIPCALATAIAAPLLLRYLQRLNVRSPGKYFRISAAAGVVVGLWVTSFAVFLSTIWLTLIAGGTAGGRSMDSAVVAVLEALAFGPLIAGICLPAIILSGSLFGLVNALLIRRGAAPGRA